MTTPVGRGAAALFPPAVLRVEALDALRRVARQIAAWREGRRRAVADRHVLARMSDRELLDIGIDRGSIDAVAHGRWQRDYPY